MKISRFEEGSAGRVFVHLEDGTVFPLSRKEKDHLKLAEGFDLSSEQLEWIYEELVFVRGRNYLIHLLYAKDYTIKEVKDKFRKAHYPEPVIESVISYGMEKRYLDDSRYAEDYIRYRKARKSIRQIKYQLSQKGISSHILDSLSEEDDREALEKKVIRYWQGKTGTDYEKSGKTYQYFVRKGYPSGIIKDILQNLSCK